MVLRRYALSIIALAILESGQWLKRELRFSFFYRTVLSPMVLRRYALSIIALAILESGQWLKRELRFSFFIKPSSHLWFSAAMLCRLLLWQFSSPASGSNIDYQKKRYQKRHQNRYHKCCLFHKNLLCFNRFVK